jgi:hypothetical protein
MDIFYMGTAIVVNTWKATPIHRLSSLSEIDASHPGKVKNFDEPLSGNALQSYNNSFFVFFGGGFGGEGTNVLPGCT